MACLLLLFAMFSRANPSCAQEERPLSWTSTRSVDEARVVILPLIPELTYSALSVTSMARKGEYLLLLPEDPFQDPLTGEESSQPLVLSLDLAQVADRTLNPEGPPLTPKQIPLLGPDPRQIVPGFQSFEALAVHGGQFYLLARSLRNQTLQSCLLRAEWEEHGPHLVLQSSPPLCVDSPNLPQGYAYGALLVSNGMLHILPEANGANCNLAPTAHSLTPALVPAASLPFPCLEFRVGDASSPDDEGFFWVLNRLDSEEREQLSPAVDSLRSQYGTGRTHAHSQEVSRLVAMHMDVHGVTLADLPPLELELSFMPPAWEGLELIEHDGSVGLLLATGGSTPFLLGFVPLHSP